MAVASSVTLVPLVIAIATVVVAACPGMKRKRQVVPMEAMMNLVALVAAAAARPRFQNTNKYLQKLIFLWRVYFVLDLTKVIYFNRQGNSAPLGLQRSIQQYRGSSSRAISSRRFSTWMTLSSFLSTKSEASPFLMKRFLIALGVRRMAVFNAIHLGQTMPTERINNMNVNLSTLSISPGIDPFFQTNNLGNTILQGTRKRKKLALSALSKQCAKPPHG